MDRWLPLLSSPLLPMKLNNVIVLDRLLLPLPLSAVKALLNRSCGKQSERPEYHPIVWQQLRPWCSESMRRTPARCKVSLVRFV